MDRNREARRASGMVASNGFNRRRHRTNSLRDSPDEDGGMELQESVRSRERVKKDRDRDRERERDSLRGERDLRERDRDSRERSSRHNHSNNKRRRAERLATSNRDDINIGGGVDETSEESINDEEDDNDNDNVTGARLPVGSVSNQHHYHQSHLSSSGNHQYHNISISQQQQQQHNNSSSINNNISNNIVSSSSNHNHHHLQHRKSYPPPSSTKVFRAPTSSVWKPADEMIGVPVPRKARSVSTKRSHDWISSSSNNNSGGGGGSGEQILRQTSGSPVGPGLVPSLVCPMSPSSSNISMRKKLKPSGSNSGVKLKPPKISSSSKPSTSNPEELEIEIAEVLYGLMTQSQGPTSKKDDSKEVVNRSSSDAKSRNSSPVSNSTSANNNPVLGSNSSLLSAVAPKRKRPRQATENPSHGARSSLIPGRPDTDPMPEGDISAPNLEKASGPAAENEVETGRNFVNSQAPVAEPTAPVKSSDLELKPVPEDTKESNSNLGVKEEVSSPKEKEVRTEDSSNESTAPTVSTATATVRGSMAKGDSALSEMENHREEKFEIDLMAPPPQARPSPKRESNADLKPVLSLMDAEMKPVVVSRDKDEETGKSGTNVAAAGEEKEDKVEESESSSHNSKGIVKNKGRNIDLQLDLEKFDRDRSAASVPAAVGFNATANRLQMQTQKQQQQMPVKATKDEPLTDKPGLSVSSLPLPMSMASWPGGLPPMGYMAPLQGVVSMDGTTVTPAPIQPLFSQPRPKRCATHCLIARNILYLQQFMKMNPFWPAAPGSASLFGSKTCNPNVVQDMQGNGAARGGDNAQDSHKGQNIVSISSNGTKDKSGSAQPGTTISDSTQRKPQIMIQQPLPPVAPSNLLGPAFIFPLNQQQAAAAAAAGKTPTTSSVAAAVSSSSTASVGPCPTAAPAAAMSFNYPNMAAPNETQYLAILQNNYPFPIPAVGAPPNYRGAPAQAIPLFNGSFYSSQMIHPSQLQHQQQPPQSTQQHQSQLLQTHQNANAPSGGSSSSQKHQQQQRPQSSSGGPGNVNLQNFSGEKPSQHLNQQMNMSRSKHLENESGGEDTQANDNTRGSRASMNIYGQNFAMPFHPQNFALMTQPAAPGASGSGKNQGEKKQHHQGFKTGVDGLPPHSFAMSFGPINATTSGIDMAYIAQAQNHAVFQNPQEVGRQNFHLMTAAAAQKKSSKISEDGKSRDGESSSAAIDDERKSFSANKPQAGGVGQSIAFTRSDLSDSAVTSNIAAASAPAHSSTRSATVGMNAMNAQNAQILAHFRQQQFLQMKQYQQQQPQHHMAASRSKVPVTSNGSVYSEHLNSSSSMAAKFPNALSGFPQNLVSSNTSSPSQSPQWKGSTSTRAPTSQVSSAAATAVKNNLPQQQHSRTQTQIQTQISFGGNQKTPPTSQGQQPTSNSNQAPSPPMMAGSPTTSSLSKGGASGSPRFSTLASTNNKTSQASNFSGQQPKNSPSLHSQKSPSILGNPHIVSSPSGGSKPQMQQQSSQPQQLPKNMQQGQLFFSNPYTQAQPTNTNSTTSGPGGYYMQRRRQDQQPQAGPATSSTGALSLSSTGTNDPAKAIAAATPNVKGGGGLPSQNIIHASQFAAQAAGGTLLPAGFSYVPVPAAVQVKPAEQKQPAGNDLHPWQPEKK